MYEECCCQIYAKGVFLIFKRDILALNMLMRLFASKPKSGVSSFARKHSFVCDVSWKYD